MARSVVFRGTTRCPHCQIAPRWCICAGARPVSLPFAVDVLMHNGEAWKPSSTGNLIRRVVPESRQIIYHNQRLPRREDVVREGRTLWILHPRGEALADVMQARASDSNETRFSSLQVLLIDGTWSQAIDMLRHTDGWGRKVCLPPSALRGGSRYWLRKQHHPGHFSTMEALMVLLGALNCEREHAALSVQFELHVYASLLARGHKADAAEYLAGSPLGEAMPDVARQLQTGNVI